MTELTAAQPGRLPVPIPRDETLFYGEAASMDEGEHIIRHYLRVFNKYRWTILGAVAACLAVALTITMLLPKEFTAVTRIQVDRQPPKIVEMDQVDQEQSGANSLEFYQTQYALLKSRSLSEQVVRDLNLENDPQFLFGHGTANKDEAALPLAKRMEMAADKLNRSTNVNPVRSSSIIDIGYQAKDPALAARVAPDPPQG